MAAVLTGMLVAAVLPGRRATWGDLSLWLLVPLYTHQPQAGGGWGSPMLHPVLMDENR